MTIPSKFRLSIAGTVLALLISCSDESPRFPTEAEVEQMYSSYSSTGSSSSSEASSSSVELSSSSAGSSSSVEISSSSEMSSSSTQSLSSVSSSSSLGVSSSSSEQQSSSSTQSSSSGVSSSSLEYSLSSEQSSSSDESGIDVTRRICRTPTGKSKVTYYNPEEKFCDARDGHVYKYVTIYEQVWMAENLNYAITGSKCGGNGNGSDLTNDNTETCNTYGRLYDWETAMGGSASSREIPSGVQGVCPTGWHLPSDLEWDVLKDFANYGCSSNVCFTAGTRLKSKTLWEECKDVPIGLDMYDFAALPGGYGSSNDGKFYNVNISGHWWTSSDTEDENRETTVFYFILYYDKEISGISSENKTFFHSVRCIKDPEPEN